MIDDESYWAEHHGDDEQTDHHLLYDYDLYEQDRIVTILQVQVSLAILA